MADHSKTTMTMTMRTKRSYWKNFTDSLDNCGYSFDDLWCPMTHIWKLSVPRRWCATLIFGGLAKIQKDLVFKEMSLRGVL
jgi:hypothetical protein